MITVKEPSTPSPRWASISREGFQSGVVQTFQVRHPERFAGHGNRDAKRGACSGLAVGAMADADLIGIGLALDGDGPALAASGNFHDCRSAAFNSAPYAATI